MEFGFYQSTTTKPVQVRRSRGSQHCQPETELVEIFVTRPDQKAVLLTGRLTSEYLTALARPVDRQQLQHLDQILPRQTGKTAVYTTVRLHYVDCQLSLHYHISIK